MPLAPMRDRTLDHCTTTGMVPLGWSPLAGGRLATGDGIRPALLAHGERVDRSHIALAFVLAHPAGVIPIIGTQDPARMAASKRALAVRLDRAGVYAIVQASEGVPLP